MDEYRKFVLGRARLQLRLLGPDGARQPAGHSMMWSEPGAFTPAVAQRSLAQLEATIVEGCESLTFVTTGIFIISIFLTILRPDPTLAICLFGFYGAHVRSMGAVRSYWFFMSISVVVDFMWIFTYSPMRPIAWDTLKAISRKDQVRAPLPPRPGPHLRARGTRRHLTMARARALAAFGVADGAQPGLQGQHHLFGHHPAACVCEARGPHQADGARGRRRRRSAQQCAERRADHEQWRGRRQPQSRSPGGQVT